MMSRHPVVLGLCLALAAAAARAAEPAPSGQRLVAVLVPTQGNSTRGVVVFQPDGDGVRATGVVTGLTAGAKHGFHVHEFGDCSAPDGTSAGDHYSPTPSQHGGTTPPHHAGDFGNIEADAKGVAAVDIKVEGISTVGGTAPLVGRGLVVHAKPDDLTSQPSGNAGPRIACGVLGYARSGAAPEK